MTNNTSLKLLAINANQFNGTIPESLSNLQMLFHLDLSNNQFTGDMPQSVAGLKWLQRLYLAENPLNPGPIPAEFERLTLLRELSLKNNSRSGTIPTFLGNLTLLKLLDLDNNDFNGTVPSEFGDLSNLEFLLLNRNEGLEGPIPDSFGKLEELRGVFLDRTNLNGSLEVLCNLATFKESPGDADGTEILSADCGNTTDTPVEVVCSCCRICCVDDDPDSCHDHDDVPSLEPEWQYGYNRVSFDFGDGNATYFQDRAYLGTLP
jgi:Leucine-rich repeat (LRR) protein